MYVVSCLRSGLRLCVYTTPATLPEMRKPKYKAKIYETRKRLHSYTIYRGRIFVASQLHDLVNCALSGQPKSRSISFRQQTSPDLD